jgi:hypothetical protein
VQVEVIRSPRRRKTVQATEAGGVVRVSIPASMSRAEEERWVGSYRRAERARGFLLAKGSGARGTDDEAAR